MWWYAWKPQKHKQIFFTSRAFFFFEHFFWLQLQARLRLPDGSPAPDVQVNVQVSPSQERKVGTTDQEGAVFSVFNIPNTEQITVEVGILLDTPRTAEHRELHC